MKTITAKQIITQRQLALCNCVTDCCGILQGSELYIAVAIITLAVISLSPGEVHLASKITPVILSA